MATEELYRVYCTAEEHSQLRNSSMRIHPEEIAILCTTGLIETGNIHLIYILFTVHL